jgi:hypothetical protein
VKKKQMNSNNGYIKELIYSVYWATSPHDM